MEDKLNELSVVNALIFGVLIATSYYVLFYQPSNPESVINGLDQNITAVKGDTAGMDKKIIAGELLKQEIEDMEAKAEKIYRYIPEDLSREQASSAVSEEARLAGLSIQSINTSPSWRDRETVSTGSVDINVKGDFTKIMIFLSELTRKETIYSIKRVQILEGNARDKDLSLNAKIEFFRRFQKTEARM